MVHQQAAIPGFSTDHIGHFSSLLDNFFGSPSHVHCGDRKDDDANGDVDKEESSVESNSCLVDDMEN